MKSRLDTLNTHTLTHPHTHSYLTCFHVEIEIFLIEIAIVFCHCVARTDVLQLLECLLSPHTLQNLPPSPPAAPRAQPTMSH